jgi:hypothetical protein
MLGIWEHEETSGKIEKNWKLLGFEHQVTQGKNRQAHNHEPDHQLFSWKVVDFQDYSSIQK